MKNEAKTKKQKWSKVGLRLKGMNGGKLFMASCVVFKGTVSRNF
jgi:hypothetical protein